MGLHHRFPPYFYKRGNLFNTYLGYTENLGKPADDDARRRHRNRTRPAASAASSEPQHRRSPGVKRFSEFVKKNLTQEDAERLLSLLARDAGVTVDLSQSPAWSVRMALAYFAEQHLGERQALRYTEVLEQRLFTGEPLIQK